MIGTDIAIILVSVLCLAYFEARAWVSVAVIGILLVGLSIQSSSHLLILFFLWFVFLFAATFMLSGKLRRRFLTDSLIRRIERKLPSISETERDAIEAGDVWWEKELFSGQPHWKKLLGMPVPALQPAEQAFLDHQVQTLCDMLDDWQIIDKLHDLPESVWQYLKQERFFGMIIPTQYGGLGFSALAHSSVITQLATRSISTAITVMVPNSLGPAELLLHYGTEAQKSWYLPRLARGDDIPCFALTAPEAGSDAGAITDSGVVCRGVYNGEEIVGICLNWDKRYITLAPIATVIGVALRLYDPDNLLGKGASPGITLCLVPASLSGVESDRRHNPMHLAFMNGPTRGRNVFVPLDCIIGGPERAGDGWRMLMECLSAGRGISLPSLSAACGQLTYRVTGAYARVRRQFNVPIASFEGITEALGDIAGYTYMMESCRLLTASAVDQKIRPAIASAISKYQQTEMARKVVAHAMDIHGGHGIQMGPENLLAHAHLAIPISITVEGANILTRNLIIFGQGAIRCHPYLLQEVNQFAAAPSEERSSRLDKLLFAHAGHAISLVVRTLWGGLTGGHGLRAPVKGPTAPLYRQLTRMSAAFALLSEVTLMLLGGELKRKERLSARLGDMLGQLYLASAVLKYFRDQGEPSSDLPYVRWCVTDCLFQLQNTIEALLDNYPSRGLARLMRGLIFPFGRPYTKPSDRLHASLMEAMLRPSALRDRLTALFFKSGQRETAASRLDSALQQVDTIEPLLKKFLKAQRQNDVDLSAPFDSRLEQAVRKHILLDEEAEALRHYHHLYLKVIKVDEFSSDLATVLTWYPSEQKEEVV